MSWELVDAPTNGRSLLASGTELLLGTTSGVSAWDTAAAEWLPLGEPLGSTVKTLQRDGNALLAGTFAGTVHRLDAPTNTWPAATAPMPLNFVHALQRYGDYLYVGAEWALYRCWTESGVWDAASVCEQIEPETGFTPELSPLDLHVHQGVLHVATSEGIRRFDALTDTWLPMNDGFPIQYEAPLHTFALTSFDGTLVVGTLAGVYRWECE